MEGATASMSGFGKETVSDLNLEVWRRGTGRPLLYLHAGDGLESQLDVLAKLAVNYEVVAPSHPGFGGSELAAHLQTVDDLSYVYLEFIEKHDFEDLVIVGSSFGGWLAAEIATKSNRVADGLILIDPVGVKFGDRMTRDIVDLFSVPLNETDSLIYSDKSRHRTNYDAFSDEHLLRLARNHVSLGRFGWSPTLHNPQLKWRLSRIGIPTLVVWGRDDKVVSPDYGRQIARSIKGASFELVDDAGHYPHVERPDAFLALADKFIQSL